MTDRRFSSAAPVHYAIDPEPFRVVATPLLGDPDLTVRVLAGIVLTMCDCYDELKAAVRIRAGRIVEQSER